MFWALRSVARGRDMLNYENINVLKFNGFKIWIYRTYDNGNFYGRITSQGLYIFRLSVEDTGNQYILFINSEVVICS